MRRPLTALLAGLALLSACVPAESTEDLGKRWDETTVMGELQRRGSIRVGVSTDGPGALVGGSGGAASGDTALGPYGAFTLDFARHLADTLGVELETVEVPHAQLQTGIETGDIDVAFPLQTITEASVRKQAFTDPLFVSHQRLLVPAGAEVESLNDLAGLQVCAVIEDDGVGLDPSVVAPDLDVTVVSTPQRCLDDDSHDAFTAPDVVLLAMQIELLNCCPERYREGLEIAGDQLTTQGFGALTRTGANAWVDYLGQVIADWKSSGGWLGSYETNFGDAFSDTPQPADLTVEEAAALFPSDG